MVKRFRSTGMTRTVRRPTSRPPSVSRARSSWGRGYSHSRSYRWGSDDGTSNPVSAAIGIAAFVIVAAIWFCSATAGSSRSSFSSPSFSYSRPTATPVASAVVRAEVAGRWTVTAHTTRPVDVQSHERQADCQADPGCEIMPASCASEEDPASCRSEVVPGTCREVQSGTAAQEANCRWQETGAGHWVDINCRPDPTDPAFEICDQEYQVEEEWVCDEQTAPVYETLCDEVVVCDEALFCDTARTVQALDETYTASGVGAEVVPPGYEVAEGGTFTETMTFEVHIVGAGYEVELAPAPATLEAYLRAVNTVYYILLDEDGEPFGHITAAELETGDYPSPQR